MEERGIADRELLSTSLSSFAFDGGEGGGRGGDMHHIFDIGVNHDNRRND
jgi:hypothetical protein